MPTIFWIVLILTVVASCSAGAALSLFGMWRDTKRELDIFVELHRISSEEARRLLAGAEVHIVNQCRDCRRLLREAGK